MTTEPASGLAGETVERIFREVDHQMDNYLPRPGESSQACRDRRLKAEFLAILSTPADERARAFEEAAGIAVKSARKSSQVMVATGRYNLNGQLENARFEQAQIIAAAIRRHAQEQDDARR